MRSNALSSPAGSWRGTPRRRNASLLLAAAMLLWFSTTEVVPAEFTTMAPYVVTLLVLAMASQNLRMPAADGLRYRRGQAG